jgi:hypothetical protein
VGVSLIDIAKIIIFFIVFIYGTKLLIKNSASRELLILNFVLLSRFLLSSFYEYSYVGLIAGQSLISLHSLMVFVFLLPYLIGYFRVAFAIKSLVFVFVILGIMFLSGMLNGNLFLAIPSIIKWVIMLEIALLSIKSINANGFQLTMRGVAYAYMYPVSMLLFSIIFGISRSGESDGSVSYVGGFYQEAVFSVVILTAFMIKVFDMLSADSVRFNKIFLCIVLFNALIAMVNYRTTVLAALVFSAGILYALVFSKRVSGIVSMVLIPIMIGISYSVLTMVSGERFADLPYVFNNAIQLLSNPDLFYYEETKLISGRLYIWSNYLSEVNHQNGFYNLFGLGMDSWSRYFDKYAHNTFVSFYFELGWLGLFGLILFFVALLPFNFSANNEIAKLYILSAIGSFFILNLGTMPMWQMEGIYLAAFIIAIGVFYKVKGSSFNVKDNC